jgi:hypothetical protein
MKAFILRNIRIVYNLKLESIIENYKLQLSSLVRTIDEIRLSAYVLYDDYYKHSEAKFILTYLINQDKMKMSKNISKIEAPNIFLNSKVRHYFRYIERFRLQLITDNKSLELTLYPKLKKV